MIMMTTETQFKEGDRVRVIGRKNRFYIVHRAEPAADGSILLYGGHPNPNMAQGYVSVMPDRLVSAKRKRA